MTSGTARFGGLARCGGAIVAAALLVIGLPVRAQAGLQFEVSSTTVTGGSSGTVEVDLQNTGSSAESIAGFSFTLNVTGGPGVTFTDVTTATTNNAYIFAGTSVFGPDITGSGAGTQAITGSDLTTQAAGVTLAAGATAGVGEVSFSTSGSFPAKSFFDVFVDITIPPGGSTTQSNVVDSNGNNIAISGSTHGTITVNPNSVVPEPSTLSIAALGVGASALAYLRKKRAAARAH